MFNVIDKTANTQLGTLLVEAGLITEDMLEIALQITIGFGESLGQVLMDTRRLTELDVQNAVLAQSWIENGLVDRKTAARTLHSSHKSRVNLLDVVRVGAFASGTKLAA